MFSRPTNLPWMSVVADDTKVVAGRNRKAASARRAGPRNTISVDGATDRRCFAALDPLGIEACRTREVRMAVSTRLSGHQATRTVGPVSLGVAYQRRWSKTCCKSV